jgi:hypothetical protein
MINQSKISFLLEKFNSGKLSEKELDILLNYFENFKKEELENSDFDFKLDESFKNSLRKSDLLYPINFQIENEKSEELFFVAAIENQLTEEEKIYFNNKLASENQLKTKFEVYKKTILPNENEVFSDKNRLKKNSRIHKLSPFFWTTGVAASFFLFFWLTEAPKSKPVVVVNASKAKVINLKPKNIKTKPDNDSRIISVIPKKKNLRNQHQDFIDSVENSESKIGVGLVQILQPDSESKQDLKNIINENVIPKEFEINNENAMNKEGLSEEFIYSIQKENRLTWKQYLIRKFNKWVFNNPTPDRYDLANKAASLLVSTTGIKMEIEKQPEKEDKMFVSSISFGRFKYEHK